MIFGFLFLVWLLLVPQHPYLLLGPGAAYLRAALADAALLAEQRHAAARTARDELVRVTSNDGLTSLPNRATLLRRTTRGLARNDVIGGQIHMAIPAMTAVFPYVSSGRLRGLKASCWRNVRRA